MKALIAIIAVLVIGAGGYFFLFGDTAQTPVDQMILEDETRGTQLAGSTSTNSDMIGNDAAPITPSTTTTPKPPTSAASDKTVTITYTDEGYSPKEVTVKKGQKVIWVNNSTHTMWPATARHPTHTVYPGSDITKCSTATAGSLFDACKEIAKGSSFTFTFTEVGAWNYHDHLNASKFGKVTVTE